MRKRFRSGVALLLSLLLVIQLCDSVIACAVEDPTANIVLTTPEDLKGGNWFFITQTEWTVSEKSTEKLYIPIQRTGDLEEEASVDLKLVDMTSHRGVNYTASIHKEDADTETVMDGEAMVDIIADPDELEEIDREEYAEASKELLDEGGVLTDSEGNPIGGIKSSESVEAETAAQDGQSGDGQIPEAPEAAGETPDVGNAPNAENDGAALSGEPAESDPVTVNNSVNAPAPGSAAEETASLLAYPTNPLRNARNQYVGTASDRQDLVGDRSWINHSTAGSYSDSDAPMVVEDYPGVIYHLDFAAGEDVKFLVIDPIYSDRAEGDATLMLLLGTPSDGWLVPEFCSFTNVTITDEDEPEEVVVSIQDSTIFAENGKAKVTVTRQGRANELVTVLISTQEGSGVTGRNFSGVGAKLYFPMGLRSRTVEIPVNHDTTEKSFYVSITPVSDCTIGNGRVQVIIPAVGQEASLQAERDLLGFDLEDNVWGSEFAPLHRTRFKGFDSMDMYWIADYSRLRVNRDKAPVMAQMSLREGWTGSKPGETDRTFFYDGVMVRWNQETGWFSGGHSSLILSHDWQALTTIWNATIRSMSGYLAKDWTVPESVPAYTVDVDAENFRRRDYLFYDSGTDSAPATTVEGGWKKGMNPLNLVITNCSTNHWRETSPMLVQQIRRTFQFDLIPALTPDHGGADLRGVSPADLAAMQTVKLNSSQTATSVSVLGGSTFAVTAANQKNLRFTAVEAVMEVNGQEVTQTIAEVPEGASTVVIDVTQDLVDDLSYKGFMAYEVNKTARSLANEYPTGDGDGTHCYGAPLKGVLKIRPVFEKIPVIVDVQPGTYGSFKDMATGEQTWYMGEKLILTTELNERGQAAGVAPTGVAVERRWSKSGEYIAKFDDYYLDETLTSAYEVDSPYIRVQPTFTSAGNTVSVKVSAADRELLDLSKGLFVDQTPVYSADTDTYTYTLADGVKISQIVNLTAIPRDLTMVPVWSTSRDSTRYSGYSFVLRAGATAEENALTLSVSRSGNQYYALSGTLYADELNLNTGAPTGVLTPAAEAVISAGALGGFAEEDGTFSLAAQRYVPGTSLRWSVGYNGGTEIMENKLPAAGAPTSESAALDGSAVEAVAVDVGMKKVPTWSSLNAHFTGFYVSQNSNYIIGTSILEMNGGKTVLSAAVDPGVGYLDENGRQKAENVTAVDFIFRDARTGEIRSVNPGEYDETTGNWKVEFERFAPDDLEGVCTYGDLLYIRMTTDRPQPGVFTGDGQQTVYAPVSTGYAVIGTELVSDQSTFESQVPVDEMFADVGLAADDGSHTTAKFKSLPYLGEIKAFIGVVKTGISAWNAIANRGNQDMNDLMADVEDLQPEDYGDGEDSFTESDGAELMELTEHGVNINVVIDFKELPYGGTRVLIGALASVGNSTYSHMTNPYGNFDAVIGGGSGRAPGDDSVVDYNNMQQIGDDGTIRLQDLPTDPSLVKNDIGHIKFAGHQWAKNPFAITKSSANWLGGWYFAFGVYLGLYMDFGYLTKTTTAADGTQTTATAFQVMGAGGFTGFMGKAGGVVPLAHIPIYFGLEGSADVKVFFGLTGDPGLTLESFSNGEEINTGDWTFNRDLEARVRGTGYVGVGLPGLLGVKASVGIQLRFSNSKKLPQWFPNNPDMADGWGRGTDIIFEGTVDLIFLSLPLYTYSYPLPLEAGSVPYLRDVRLARQTQSLIDKAVNDAIDAGKYAAGSAEVAAMRAQLQSLDDVLRDNTHSSSDPINKKRDEVRDYALKNGFITQEQYDDCVWEGRAGGIITMVQKYKDGTLLSGEARHDYFVPDYEGSRWVANDGASLMASFKQADSKPILEDTVNQPEPQLLDLGNGNVLLAFLDADASLPAGDQSVLKLAVLNTETGRWTAEPAAVQGDGTGDFAPNLCDCGDAGIMLSWASTDPDKRKETADPLDSLAQLDIFSVMLNRNGNVTGKIEQLTNDNIRDYNPQGIYDPSTGNRMVMYIKTAPDTDYQAGSDAQKFFDYADPYAGDKIYSVTAYMLYNSQTDVPDNRGETHEPGWARTYYFDNDEPENIIPKAGQTPEEAYQDYLDAWGGQRFLPSPIKDANGNVEQEDPPIGDLTVSMGTEGVAAFAYTVDTDMKSGTWDDKELFVQFYDFQTHKCYVPVRLTEDNFSQTAPQLVRSGNQTRLFFLNGLDTIYYMNISEMLTATVPTSETDETPTHAMRNDGTFVSGYQPSYHLVDTYGDMSTGELGKLTGFTAYVDGKDDLYVVYPATVRYADEKGREHYAQEIFATGYVDENEDGDVIWSAPVQLTTGNKCNSEPAVTTDSDGNLILVHNQYEMIDRSGDQEWLEAHATVVVETDESGNEVETVKTPFFEVTPTSLVMTRCAPVGSLVCSQVGYSDVSPEPGDEITVGALLGNTGLTSVRKGHVDVFEYVDGKQGNKISGGTFDVEEPMKPNASAYYTFQWQVPDTAEKLAQTSLLFEITEYDQDGNKYDTLKFVNGEFVLQTDLSARVDSIQQQGNVYQVEYSVTNDGNLPAEPMYVRLSLAGLYGDLKTAYGVDSAELCGEDLETLAPGETKTYTKTVTVPASVFELCGYDAVKPELTDPKDHEGVFLSGESRYIIQEAPFDVELNDGRAVALTVGQTKAMEVTYALNAVADQGTEVVYTVSDPSVATVKDGVLTALGAGSAIVTVTLLPYGVSDSIPVTVDGGGSPEPTPTPRPSGGGGGSSSPANAVIVPSTTTYGTVVSSAANARAGEKVTITLKPDDGYEVTSVTVTDAKGNVIPVTDNGDGTYSFTMPDSTVSVSPAFVKIGERPDSESCPKNAACPISRFTDARPDAWYHDGVHWALVKGIMNGTGDTTFEPDGSATRAMVVTMLWRLAGEPASSTAAPFNDVKAGSWYADAVNWAAETGAVKGTSETTFSPDTPVTREQLAAILYRYAQAKGKGFTGAWMFPLDFSDAASISEWADEAMHWMTMHGVINGMGDGTLAPQDNATRAQIATMFMRFCGEMEK